MKIGIIGPSDVNVLSEINPLAKKIIKELVGKLLEFEIVVTPDKGSASEFFAKDYFERGGLKVSCVVPLDDKEFGYAWINLNLGEIINCGIWRNQPEKLNEETDALLCLGYAAGVLAEIAYSKWFKPKKVYVVKELVCGELPKELNRSLKIEYISFKNFGKELKC